MLLKEIHSTNTHIVEGYVSNDTIQDLVFMASADFTFRTHIGAEAAELTIYRVPSGTYNPGTYNVVVTTERTFNLDDATGLSHVVSPAYIGNDAQLQKIANIIAKKLEPLRLGAVPYFAKLEEIVEQIFDDFSDR